MNNKIKLRLSDMEIILGKKYTLNDFESMAKKILSSKNPEYEIERIYDLDIKDVNNQLTFAHVLAYYGYIIKDFNVLQLKDFNGISVAHYVATKQPNTFNFDYLSKDERLHVLNIKDHQNSSVAHSMALIGHEFNEHDELDILKLKDFHNRSVAHFMALNNKANKISSSDILSMKDDSGISVLELVKSKIEQ